MNNEGRMTNALPDMVVRHGIGDGSRLRKPVLSRWNWRRLLGVISQIAVWGRAGR